MADVSYSVELKFLTGGNFKVPQLPKMPAGFGGSSGLTGSIMKATFATEALHEATRAVAAGWDIVKSGLVDYNAALESARIGMAAIFTANDWTKDFNAGLETSAVVIENMRKAAMTLPGEFKDLVNIFQSMSTAAAKSGMSIRETQDLAKRSMAYGIATGVRPDVIGREMAALISGQASGRNLMANRLPGLSLHGAEAKKFNALEPEKRNEILMKALGMRGGKEAEGINNAIKAYEHSWEGAFTSLRDRARQFGGAMTEGLFEKIKTVMIRLNDWFDRNEDKILTWAHKIGRGLEIAFDWALKKIEKWGPVIEKIANKTTNWVASGEAKHDVSMAGGAAAGLGAVKTLAPLVESMGGLEIAGIGAGSAMGILASILIPVAGIVTSATDSLSFFHDTIIGLWNSLEVVGKFVEGTFADSWKTLEPTIMNLAGLAGSVLMSSFVGLGGVLGMIGAIVDGAAHAFIAFAHSIANLIDKILDNKMGQDGAFALEGVGKKLAGGIREFVDPHAHKGFSLDDWMKKKTPDADLDKKNKPESAPRHTTHIHKVEIKVESNQDPMRIAKAVQKEMDDVAKYARQSALNPATKFTTGKGV